MRNRSLRHLGFALFVVFLSISVGPATAIGFAVAASNILLPENQSRHELIKDPSLRPLEQLPDRTFVLNGTSIVDSMDFVGPEYLLVTQAPASGNTLVVTATVIPSRLIVVDANGDITGIWSNTSTAGPSYYALMVRQGSMNGDEHPLTDHILDQYNNLLDQINWAVRGRVYPAGY